MLMSDYKKAIHESWLLAPEWAKFIAIDRDGEIWAFEFQPTLGRKKNWRCREPDGKAKFLMKFAGTGYYGSVNPLKYRDNSLKCC